MKHSKQCCQFYWMMVARQSTSIATPESNPTSVMPYDNNGGDLA